MCNIFLIEVSLEVYCFGDDEVKVRDAVISDVFLMTKTT